LTAPAATERAVPATRKRPLPWLAHKTAAPPEDAQDQGDVVDLTAHRAGGPAPAEAHGLHDQRAELETAFGADTAAEATEASATGDKDDVAFQVTLPRSVIRQIRMRAARDETTHRAIVLRALRAAGLSIPEGADVDRRVLAAKRRQQA